MEPQQPHQPRPQHQPHRHGILPPLQSQQTPAPPPRTANSTPVSSPGLFSPSNSRVNMSSASASEGTTPAAAVSSSPYLHPLQSHKVRETHKALVDTDFLTGRKLINHYEIIEELGRGMHGKVKLARNLETGESVAIKIIPRFSKKRRLGKITTMSAQDKSKKEIAILKKIRHPNVVALLEVIDDPELKKIYMVLEHVELGEIVWRKKGLPFICTYERRRAEREMRGEKPTPEEETYELNMDRRQAVKDVKRAKASQAQAGHADYWSLEYGGPDDEADADLSRSIGPSARSVPSNSNSLSGSRATSRAPSRTQSYRSLDRAGTPHPSDPDLHPVLFEDDMETPGPLRSNPVSSSALDGTMYGAYDDPSTNFRGRSPSMPDSIISHMSSIDYGRVHDPYADDYSYVPCFTFDHARRTFRDTVLGLEYLHYEGVVHRDIKPSNLLWTRDHRVKISDFGVSYFGRPIRDGEPDDAVSESEARDFDNDLELAKTVGTPAFFAPELCYTDAIDDRPGHVQPKVTEQIDVWSLGVTLYCLIFARIPFLAEDEWQMFRKIATEDVYIPSKRLRPVDPSTKPNEKSLYTRVNSPPYRDDQELAYEDIDPDLRDLLRRMLTKAPDKRIRLRDVKRHNWVTKGMDNVIAWLDDTEPARRTSGRRIQVDAREMEHAVVPLTFLERARSAVKKAVGKVMHNRPERGESSRRRATSSVASSAGDSPSTVPSTPYPRDQRRKSLRGDLSGSDYFATNMREQPSGERRMPASLTVSPHESPLDEAALTTPLHSNPQRDLRSPADSGPRPDLPERQIRRPAQRTLPRHSHAHSVASTFLPLTPSLPESRTVPTTPGIDSELEDPMSTLRTAREMKSSVDDTSRARSVDRGLFVSTDKRAKAKVALSTAMAPGSVHLPHRSHPIRPFDIATGRAGPPLPSPVAIGPRPLTGYQHGQPKSDPNIHDKQRAAVNLEERPMTAHRIPIGDVPDAKTPPPRIYNASTPESFARAQESNFRRKVLEYEDTVKRESQHDTQSGVDPSMIPCPPSPDDEIFFQRGRLPRSRVTEDSLPTAVSSSSTSMGALTTPLTSPSETTSPLCMANPQVPNLASSTTAAIARDMSSQANAILAFQSDPSLPALLSSTSSVSADLEGEMLGNPGSVVGGQGSSSSALETTDSLTPPAMVTKDAEVLATGLPLQELVDHGAVPVVSLDDETRRLATKPALQSLSSRASAIDDDDDDSDSDEGLTMFNSKKAGHHNVNAYASNMGRVVTDSKRRDTATSAGSTDTAKKVAVIDKSD